jgi:hypothetical protein
LEILRDGFPFTSPQAFFWQNGTSHEIGVNSPQTRGDSLYEFAFWSDGGDTIHPIQVPETDTTFTATFTKIPPPAITIDTDPPGLEIRVDYGYYNSPETFHWLVGSSHYVEVYATRTRGDSIFEFSHWSDGGEIAHTITTPYVDSTFTAHYTIIPPARVTVTTDPTGLEVYVDGTPGPAPQVFDWKVGTYHYLRAFSPQIRGDTLYEFVNWSNDGGQTQSIITPNADTTFTAYYSASPLRDITVNTIPSGLEIIVDDTTFVSPHLFQWWEGKQHEIGVPYSQLVGDSIYIYSHWSDGGDQAHTITVPDSNAMYTAYYEQELPHAVIDSIVDIPDDQGGWVRVHFRRSGYDIPEEPAHPISTYNIWQRIDDAALVQLVSAEGNENRARKMFERPVVEWKDRYFLFESADNQTLDLPLGTWEVIGSFAAAQQNQYIYRASTLADTTASAIPYSVYVVTAHTTTPSVWFTSAADSGFSVDNLAPATPRGFTGHYEYASDLLTLTWQPNSEADLSAYRVYRGEGPDFVPSEDNLVDATVENSLIKLGLPPIDPWHFKLSATDVHDNESEYTVLPPELITVPALISNFGGNWDKNAVEVSWRLNGPGSDLEFRVYRKYAGAGSFQMIQPDILQDDNRYSFRDGSISQGQSYTYRVVVTEDDLEIASFETTVSTPVLALGLEQNYPNPFNPTTTISFTIPNAAVVNLSIFNLEGKLVRNLVDSKLQEGVKEVTWDGRDTRGNPVSTGVYLYRLEAENKALTKKMVLIK